jgi:hypothetical protein
MINISGLFIYAKFRFDVFTGIKIVNMAPAAFPFSNVTLPPRASVNPFTMESPSPEPDVFKLFVRENL